MKKVKGTPRPPGQLRQSQVITTFGPGAMVDLPDHAVLIGGLESWSPQGGEEIHEPRLVTKLKRLLDVSSLNLREPPPDREDPTLPPTNLTAWQFPEWFITQDVDRTDGDKPIRSRMLVHRRALTRSYYIDDSKKKHPVVPVRFVRACRAGHIGEIPWRVFVHEGTGSCQRQMWIDERGTTGDLSEIWVRCECGVQRPLKEAAGSQSSALGRCDGARPWLGGDWREVCSEPNRLLIRTASNAYFPQLMSVISLPDRDEKVKAAVDAVWEYLEEATSLDDIKHERKKKKVQAALEEISNEEVLAELNARRGVADTEPKSVRRAELETLISSKEEIGVDKPDGVFFARTLPNDFWARPWMQKIERVVLVQRLREVTAQVGFTRFEPLSPDIEGELAMGVKRASLARELSWLPAVENRGEGVFIQFKAEEIASWLEKEAVKNQFKRLDAGFKRWLDDHPQSHRVFPGLPYLMLHSFSHLLITAVSLECGYPASSIRERVYAIKDVGYGVLLYTGSPDAEGTLGGLVEVGRRIHDHIQNALRLGELCSNDPVCAQHQPESAHERRFLHGAACHGCLLIAETSCEQHNDFLDRALVLPTVEGLGCEFFSPGEQ